MATASPNPSKEKARTSEKGPALAKAKPAPVKARASQRKNPAASDPGPSVKGKVGVALGKEPRKANNKAAAGSDILGGALASSSAAAAAAASYVFVASTSESKSGQARTKSEPASGVTKPGIAAKTKAAAKWKKLGDAHAPKTAKEKQAAEPAGVADVANQWLQDMFGSGEKEAKGSKAKASATSKKENAGASKIKKKPLREKERVKGSGTEHESGKKAEAKAASKALARGNSKSAGQGAGNPETVSPDPWADSSDEEKPTDALAKNAPEQIAASDEATETAAGAYDLEQVVVQEVPEFPDEEERKKSVEFVRPSLDSERVAGMAEAAKMLEIDNPVEVHQSQTTPSRLKVALNASGGRRSNFFKAPTNKLFGAVNWGAAAAAGAAGAFMGTAKSGAETAAGAWRRDVKKQRKKKDSVVESW